MTVIVTALIIGLGVLWLFIFTGGHDSIEDQIIRLISPAMKERFKIFKKKYNKQYSSQQEEEKRLIIFDKNFKEMI